MTGTSKVPLQGFSMLEGMNGVQKFQIHRDDRSTDRLPCAHTWYLYITLDKIKARLPRLDARPLQLAQKHTKIKWPHAAVKPWKIVKMTKKLECVLQ